MHQDWSTDSPEQEWSILQIYRKRLAAGEVLKGEDAIRFMALEFAEETHGNYSASTLYNRAIVGNSFKVTVSAL